MDIVLTGRHVQITDAFREQATTKLTKVAALAPKVFRIDVVVTHQRIKSGSECVEITCHAKGPVIRAEACADEKAAAFEAAYDKLMERLRRAHSKRTVHRRARVADALVAPEPVQPPPAEATEEQGLFGAVGDSPIEVREKIHVTVPMTLEDALRRMELVGHDFFFFHDSEHSRPSVVYRRRGWSYGVLHLDLQDGYIDAEGNGILIAEQSENAPAS